MPKKKIAIIGGGAAGFFAAISAAEHHPGANISIYEASNRLLAKVLISGGGRCNVTNNTLEVAELIQNYPRGNKELRGPLSRFGVSDTIDWFNRHGVTLKIEPDKRMFPTTDDSESIAQCLIQSAKKLGIKIFMKHKVSKIVKSDLKFKLSFQNSENDEHDKIILTTGGSRNSFNLAKSLGHNITPLVPSLFSFEIQDSKLRELSGVSFSNVNLELICPSLKKYKQSGPILITHWGLSGPAIIKLSALAAKDLFASNYSAKLKINFLPKEKQFLEKLLRFKQENFSLSKPILQIPKRYWQKTIDKITNKKTWAELSKKELSLIATELTQAEYEISGKGIFKEEFVTCGGIDLKEVNFQTMESKITPGLFFAGEVLDIDGLTGGFNFQAAWTTGWIAGKS